MDPRLATFLILWVQAAQSLPADVFKPTPGKPTQAAKVRRDVHIHVYPTQKVDCGNPPAPDNGKVVLTQAGKTTEGATATQSCDAGYDRVGDGNIVCQTDSSWSASSTCISQATDPPVWSADTETTSVNEGVKIGTVVTVTATLTNTPNSIEIRGTSTGKDATKLFKVSLSSGNVRLVTNGNIDRETTTQFVLVLRATNNIGHTGTETNGDLELTVNVNDVNDNNPVFSPDSKCTEINAGKSGPLSLATLTATDADTAAYGIASSPYSFASSQAKFTIVASTGEVSLKSGEALSAGPKLIAVTAVDKGSPKRTGTGTVVVCVAMKCCQTGCCPLPPEPPEWTADTETTSITEDAKIGWAVKVTSKILNTPNAIEIRETSIGAGATSLFKVSLQAEKVKLVVNGPLDRETTPQFVLILRAYNDAGNTRKVDKGDLELTVDIVDVNDNAPIFTRPSLCKELEEGIIGPAPVATLPATDADTPLNGIGRNGYRFVVSQQKFSIDAETGEVTVKKKRELEHGAYILAIRVNDQGSGQLSATASLTVCVEMDCCSSGCCSIVRDVNAPVWSDDTESISISEDVPIGTVLNVTSTLSNDPTSIFILRTSFGAGATTSFSVSLSGPNVMLVTNTAIDRERTPKFVLKLHAQNSGGTTATGPNGDLELTIDVEDLNDNDPVFQPASKCKEMENGTTGPISIDTLGAIDPDSAPNSLGPTSYTFVDTPTDYELNEATGEVFLKTGLTMYNGSDVLGIVATDQGAERRSATGSLTICVVMFCCEEGCCSGAAVMYGKAVVLLSAMMTIFYH